MRSLTPEGCSICSHHTLIQCIPNRLLPSNQREICVLMRSFQDEMIKSAPSALKKCAHEHTLPAMEVPVRPQVIARL